MYTEISLTGGEDIQREDPIREGLWAGAKAQVESRAYRSSTPAFNPWKTERAVATGEMRASGRSFGEELRQGYLQASEQATSGWMKTFQALGAGNFDDAIREREARAAYTHYRDTGIGLQARVAHNIGQAVENIQEQVVAGAIGAATGTGLAPAIVNIWGRSFGANVDKLMDAGVDPEAAYLWGAIESTIEAATEFALGPQRGVVRGVQSPWIRRAAARVMKNTYSREVAESAMDKYIWHAAKPALRNMLLGGRGLAGMVAEETAEEYIQQFSSDLIDSKLIVGRDIDWQPYKTLWFDTAVQVMPMALFGASLRMHHNYKVNNMLDRMRLAPDEKTQLRALTQVDKQGNVSVLPIEVLDQTRASADALAQHLATLRKVDTVNAPKLADVMYNMSVHMAAMDSRSPLDYFKDLAVAAVQKTSGQLRNVNAVLKQERPQAADVYEALRKDIPGFENTIYTVSDLIEVRDANAMSEGIKRRIVEQAAAKDERIYFDDDHAELTGPIGDSLSKIIPDPQPGLTYKLEPSVVKQLLPEKVFVALYTMGVARGIKIGGSAYDLWMRRPGTDDGGMLLTPAKKAAPPPTEIDKPTEVSLAQARMREMHQREEAYNAAASTYTGIADAKGPLVAIAIGEPTAEVAEAPAPAMPVSKEAPEKVVVPGPEMPGIAKETALPVSDLAQATAGGLEAAVGTQKESATIQDVVQPSEELRLPPAPVYSNVPDISSSGLEAGLAFDSEAVSALVDAYESIPKRFTRKRREAYALINESRNSVSAQERANAAEAVRRLNAGEGDVRLATEQALEAKRKPQAGTTNFKAAYLQGRNLAVFFRDATPADIVHEWLHHLIDNNLLPAKYIATILRAFGVSTRLGEDPQWNREAEEKFIGAFMQFIRRGIFPKNANVDMVSAFADMKTYFSEAVRGVKSVYGSVSLPIDVDNAFMEWFGEPIQDDPLARAVGYAMVESLAVDKDHRDLGNEVRLSRFKLDTLRHEQLRRFAFKLERGSIAALREFAKEQGITEVNKKGEVSTKSLTDEQLREFISRRLTDDAGYLSDEEVDDIALKRTGVTWSELDDNQQTVLALDLHLQQRHKQRAKARELQAEQIPVFKTAQVNAAVEDIAAEQESLAGPAERSRRARAMGGEGAFQKVTQMADRIKANSGAMQWGRMVSSDFMNFWTLAHKLTDGNEQGAFYRHVIDRADNMIREAAARNIQTKTEIADDIISAGGVVQNWHKRVVLAGREYSMSDVLGIYLITRASPTDTKAELDKNQKVRSLIESLTDLGDDPYQTIREAADYVLHKSVGYSTVDTKTRVVKLTDTRRPGSKKINPALNFVRVADLYFTRIKPELDRVYKLVEPDPEKRAKGIGNIDAYFPMIRKNGFFLENDWAVQHNIFPTPENNRVATDSRMRTRTGGGIAPVDLDATKVFAQYAAQMDNYIAKAESIQILGAILNDSKDVFVRRFGDSEYIEAMRRLLQREEYATGEVHAVDGFERFIRGMRANMQTHFLAGNISSVLRQPVSYAGVLAELPLAAIPRTLLNLVSSFKHLMGSAVTQGPASKANRWDGYEPYEVMKVLAPDMLRFHEPELENAKRHGKGFMNVSLFGKPLREWGMAGIRNADQVTVIAGWWSAYQAELARLKDMVEPDVARKQAAKFATRVIRRSQPPRGYSDLTLWQSDAEWKRALTPFSGQLMITWQHINTQVIGELKYAWRRGKNATGTSAGGFQEAVKVFVAGKDAQTTSVLQQLFFRYALTGIVIGMTFRRRPPNEEEFLTDMFMFGMLPAVPIVGPALSLSYQLDWRDSPSTPTYLQAWDSLKPALSDVLKFEVNENTMWDVAEGMGTTLAVPRILINGTHKYFKEEDPKFMDIIGLDVKETK